MLLNLNFIIMKNPVLASESFSRGNTHYFLDLRLASNHANYFQFTQSSLLQDQSYKRNTLLVWNRDIEDFISGLSSLLYTAAHLDQQDVSVHQLRDENQQRALNGIKALEPAMRPREKLVTSGAGSLSNTELLALLIGSGSADESAVALGARIMALVGYDARKLDGLHFADLCRLKGMGLAKSSAVLSAIELSRRMQKQGAVLRPCWVHTGTAGH